MVEALPTTSQVEFINKQEFAKTTLDENSEIFVIYVAALEVATTMPFHSSRTSQVWDPTNPTLAIL